jgi:hypothetical protein
MARIISAPVEALPYPTTAPGEPSGVMQRIQASPESFGGLIGAGEQRLGAGAEQGSSSLFGLAVAQQNFHNQVVADQTYNQLQDQYNTITYGDPTQLGPDGQPNTGLNGMKGRAAMDAYPKVRQQYDDIANSLRSGLQNDRQRLEFDEYSRRMRTIYYEKAGAIYDRASNEWGKETQIASALTASQVALTQYNDPNAVQSSLETARDSGVKEAQHDYGLGLDPSDPIAKAYQLKNTSNVVRSAVTGYLSHGDVDGATAFVQSHAADVDPTTMRELLPVLTTKSYEQQGAAAYNAIKNGTAPSSALPQAAVVPDQYKPLVDQAAAQYKVPPELLARVLDAENGFNPTGTSPKGAQGIAQFMPTTAAQYGVDPNDPASAIPGAAHYLADLHNERGSWHAALTGYLGGDPKNDRSYTRAGAWQYADQIDRGITSALPEVWGDSLGVGLHNQIQSAGTVHGGDMPETIFNNIKAEPPQYWNGKQIILSSGTNGNDLPTVEQTIKYLKNNGADVAVIGYGSKYVDRDHQLQDIAQRNGVAYVASGANDGTHMSPAGYRDAAQRAQAALAVNASQPSDQIVGQPNPAAPTAQLVASSSSTPPPNYPSSYTELSQRLANNASEYKRITDGINAATLPIQAHEYAMKQATESFHATESQLNAMQKAIIDQRAATVDTITQKMMANPSDADGSILKDIQTNPALEGQRDNILKTYDSITKDYANGITRDYGTDYAKTQQALTLPPNDPNRIYDVSQLLHLSQPKADGSFSITPAGLVKLQSDLKQVQETPAGKALVKTENDLNRYAAGQIIPGINGLTTEAIQQQIDPADLAKAGQFNVAFDAFAQEQRANGKPFSEIYTKENVDKLLADGGYLGTPASQVQKMVAAFRKMAQDQVATQNRAANSGFSGPPRQSNETPEQYLARIGASTVPQSALPTPQGQ